MNKVLTIVITIVITTGVLVGVVWLVFDKFIGINLGTALSGKKIESTYDHPLLTDAQEELVKSFGIDPATLPTTIPSNLEPCTIDALGIDRVNQIKSGSTPTLSDYLKAKECFH